MAVIALRDVVALLGRFPALAGIDLTVDAGEIVLLQGGNGAGKTSLLRLCAGLLAPESGVATVLGHDLSNDRRSVRRRVGLVGHTSGLFGDLSVRENAEFWAEAAGVDRADGLAALARLGVPDRLFDVTVNKLSAGQKRRTAIASIAARRPELWLMDEPHAGLDQGGRDIVDRLILDAAAAGATVLVASHELDRVKPLTPRQVTIAGGLVTADEADPHESNPNGSNFDA